MKKLVFEAFALTLIIGSSVFFVGCEKEAVTVEKETNSTAIQQIIENPSVSAADMFILPKGLDEKPAQAKEYTGNLTESQLTVLKENYRIRMFLIDNNLIESIENKLQEGQLYTDIELNNYLSAGQMTALRNYSLELNARAEWCSSTWTYHCCGYCTTPGHGCGKYKNQCNFNGHYYYRYATICY